MTENEWTSTHKAMTDALAAREKLINELLADIVKLTNELNKALEGANVK
jgi:hypothetical protein